MSDNFDEVKFAAMVIMTCSILLEGKMQCVENPNDQIIQVSQSFLLITYECHFSLGLDNLAGQREPRPSSLC